MLFLFELTLLQSCYYDVVIEAEETTTQTPSFSGNVLPILISTCATCHDGAATLPDLRDANAYKSIIQGNYISVSDTENSPLIQKIRSGHPYANALTESEIQRIVGWIKEGAPNN